VAICRLGKHPNNVYMLYGMIGHRELDRRKMLGACFDDKCFVIVRLYSSILHGVVWLKLDEFRDRLIQRKKTSFIQ